MIDQKFRTLLCSIFHYNYPYNPSIKNIKYLGGLLFQHNYNNNTMIDSIIITDALLYGEVDILDTSETTTRCDLPFDDYDYEDGVLEIFNIPEYEENFYIHLNYYIFDFISSYLNIDIAKILTTKSKGNSVEFEGVFDEVFFMDNGIYKKVELDFRYLTQQLIFNKSVVYEKFINVTLSDNSLEYIKVFPNIVSNLMSL